MNRTPGGGYGPDQDPYATAIAPSPPAGSYPQPGRGTIDPGPVPGPYGYSSPVGSQYPPSTGRPPLDPVSVVSLVTAVLGLTLVGLVTGLVGVSRTSGGRRRGRGLAVAGVVVSVLLGVVQALVLVSAWPSLVEGFEEGLQEAVSEDAGTEGEGQAAAPAAGADPAVSDDGGSRLVEPFDLVVGDCFMDPPEGEFYELTVVGCDVPHDGEVVALVELEDGSWPGQDGVDEAAWDACMTATTDSFQAAGVAPTGLDYWNFTPTREGWVLYGDRQVQCLAYDPEGQLTAPVMP